MTIIIHRPDQPFKPTWIRWFLTRIKNNKNNLVAVVGRTGSGKSWSALSICEMLAKESGIPFGIDNVVFTLKDLMHLVNHGNLKSGANIVFDEPQTEINAREFQTLANKVFGYLITTFRHRNLTLFFCTPFEDLLDKTCRKLFHATFLTVSINRNTKTVRLKPKESQYNSHYSKFYVKRLKYSSKPKGKTRYITKKLKYWDIPKPSKELLKLYEIKKIAFTTKLNQEIEQKLEAFDQRNKEKLLIDTRKELTEPQEQILKLLASGKSVKEITDLVGTNKSNIYAHLERIRTKGYKTKY